MFPITFDASLIPPFSIIPKAVQITFLLRLLEVVGDLSIGETRRESHLNDDPAVLYSPHQKKGQRNEREGKRMSEIAGGKDGEQGGGPGPGGTEEDGDVWAASSSSAARRP